MFNFLKKGLGVFTLIALLGVACSSPVIMDPGTLGDNASRNFSSSWSAAYFRGTANGWAATSMELIADNVWATTQDFSGQSTPRFKIDRFGNWAENYPAADYTVTGDTYVVTFNDSNNVVNAQLESSLDWDTLYFRGTANGWANTLMTQVSATVWETTQDFTGQSNPRFKLDRYGDWTNSFPGTDYLISSPGLYTIQFNTISQTVTATPASTGTVATPTLNPASGNITTSQSLSATISTSGAVIRYTLDGSDPTSSSTIFPASGLTLSEGSRTVKIRGFKDSWSPSAVVTGTFNVSSGSGASIGENHPSSGAYAPVNEASWGSATWEMGAHYVSGEGSDLEIAVFSKNGTRVLLEIYSTATGTEALYDYWMVRGSDDIWRAKLNNVPGKVFYAFRVWGPNWPYTASWDRGNSSAGYITDVDSHGNRFNPNKVLYDVYAKELSHDKETPAMFAAGENGGMYGTGGTDVDPDYTYTGPITGGLAIDRRNVDTGVWAIKSIALDDNTDFGVKPAIPEKEGIIYEAHVRGITQHPSAADLGDILSGLPEFSGVVNVPAHLQGTYAGAAYVAPYLAAMGYTTIELLPVHETANDINPDDNSGGNYWGYMTYGYFAPDRRYSYDKTPGGPTSEFKQMVKAFHDNGLEVYIDVVYNHTGEGGIWTADGTVSELTGFRGFDNEQYYALVDGARQFYWESTGCGNNFDASNPIVKQVIKDSLTYWVVEMGVDGFRFDLAPVLGRDSYPNYYYNPNAQLLQELATYQSTYNVEMVAEAWDISSYGVGTFPYGWGEWNGHFRDAFRRFLKGDGNTGNFTDNFNGDYWSFNDNGGPHKSVNFIVAHDGFTLADLVSYNLKNNVNVSWPFGPSDGGNDSNDAWDSGGDQALRRQRIRNFWATQFMARGVPMTVWGDEFSRTQNGNNNPYNIDSVATWSNYWQIGSDSPQAVSTGAGGIYHNNLGADINPDGLNSLFLFAKDMIQLRGEDPVLAQDNYGMVYDFKKSNGFTALGGDDRAIWLRIDGSSRGGKDYLVFINTWTSEVNFRIPTPDAGKDWVRIVDTSAWAEYTDNFWEVGDADAWRPTSFPDWGGSGKAYGLNSWAVAIFVED